MQAQSATLRYERDVPGFTDIYGRFHRGYRRTLKPGTRSITKQTCAECRHSATLDPTHPVRTTTYRRVMGAINNQRRRLRHMGYALDAGVYDARTTEQRDKLRAYLTEFRVMLDVCAYHARNRAKQGLKCPEHYSAFIQPDKLDNLRTLWTQVIWHSRDAMPPWEKRKENSTDAPRQE